MRTVIQEVLTRWWLLAIVALIAAIAVACTDSDGEGMTPPPDGPTSGVTPVLTPPPPPPTLQLSPQPPEVSAAENVLAIPDFEECPAGDTPCGPWFALKPPDFLLSDVARSGSASALLQMREPIESTETKVFYLVQEVFPDEFPEVLSGYYRVENWVRGTEKQYLQFVVIVWRAENAPFDASAQRFGNHQIRYILDGISEDPFAIANAKFIYLDTGEPTTDEWVPFRVNVKQDFIDQWGEVPVGYERIRLLYEVRYDDKLPEAAAEADVYYDDLYFGPAEGSPVQ